MKPKVCLTVLVLVVGAAWFSSCHKAHLVAPAPVAPLANSSFFEQFKPAKEITVTVPDPQPIAMANGLKAWVYERHDIPMVYIKAQVRGGSIYDPPDKEGLAYLTGWALTEGTKHYSPQDVHNAMDAVGANVSSVGYNESCLTDLTCLSSDVEKLFPIFAEILSQADFPEKELLQAKRHIASEIKRTYDDAGKISSTLFKAKVFGSHPYNRDTMGTIPSVSQLTRDDVLAFYRRYYQPRNCALLIVGDISVSQATKLLATNLGTWQNEGDPLLPVAAPEQIKTTAVYLFDQQFEQSHVCLGHIGINRVNPDQYAIRVLGHILGSGSLNSRLGREIRIKRGLTYDISAMFAEREFTGEFEVSSYTKNETTGEMIELILQELNKIRTERVEDEELTTAKNFITGSFPLSLERYESIADQLLHNIFYGRGVEFLRTYCAHIRAVTADDVLRVAKQYLHPDAMVITVVGPADKIKPQLEKFGPITMVEKL